MPALSYFSIVTWFAPKNVVIANLVSPKSRETDLCDVSVNKSVVWGCLWLRPFPNDL